MISMGPHTGALSGVSPQVAASSLLDTEALDAFDYSLSPDRMKIQETLRYTLVYLVPVSKTCLEDRWLLSADPFFRCTTNLTNIVCATVEFIILQGRVHVYRMGDWKRGRVYRFFRMQVV
jgi:hypothetical protein